MRKVAISQSNYIPWKGYFDLISSADIFVIYDTVQYTRRDWRNRNKIKKMNGLSWVTIPIKKEEYSNTLINHVQVMTNGWYLEHLNQIKESYRKAPFYEEVIKWLEKVYLGCNGYTYLSQINKHFILAINEVLGIGTKIVDSVDFEVENEKNQKLIDICTSLEATHYISGPAAKSYLDENLFHEHGITVEWMDYTGYPEYLQLYGEFEHAVSILDLMFNVGLKESKFFYKKK